MTRTFLSAIAAVLVSTGAQAATIEIDVGDLVFSNALDGVAPYQLGGDTTFLLDTATQAITGVGVTSPETGVAYTSGTWTLGEIDLLSAGTLRINIDPFVTLAQLEGLAVGESFTNFPSGDETESLISGGFFAFINGPITATRIADIGGEIPVPASLPLLLGGLGAFAFLRRRAS